MARREGATQVFFREFDHHAVGRSRWAMGVADVVHHPSAGRHVESRAVSLRGASLDGARQRALVDSTVRTRRWSREHALWCGD